jgi:hypothetical protein
MAKKPKPPEAPKSKYDEPLSKKLWPKIPAASWWTWDRVRPYPHNARTHPPAQVTLLATLLRKYGPDQPIVVDEEGVILKGHGRRLAAIEGELGGFWVLQRTGLPEAEKIAMRIADNQVALLAGWDRELVRMETRRLEADGYSLELLGFGKAELVAFQTVPGPPSAFQQYGEDIHVDHECPRCGFQFSGNNIKRDGDAALQMRMPNGDTGEGSSGEAKKPRAGARQQGR